MTTSLGAELFLACGMLMMRPANVAAHQHGVADRLSATVSLAERFGIRHEVLTGAQIRDGFPMFHVTDDYRAYFEPGRGLVRPEAAVRAQLQLAARRGARLLTGARVVRCSSSSSGVVVETSKGTVRADVAVLAAGPWIGELLPEPVRSWLTVHRQVLHWVAIEAAAADRLSPEHTPVFIWTFGNGPSDYVYGFPALEGAEGGLKAATESYASATSAATVNRIVPAGEFAEFFDRYLRGRIAGLLPEPVRSRTCLYTVTPDAGFIVDTVPQTDRIWMASPCSGHGFKHSAGLGEALAQRIVDGRSDIDLTPFSAGRLHRAAPT